MPQSLIDTPGDWQDVIVVPAPGEPAAVANDPAKPYSLFHALAALAKRTRWLREEINARRAQWVFQPGAAATYTPSISMTVTLSTPGLYLLEGHATWAGNGYVDWYRRLWVNTTLVMDSVLRILDGGGTWVDKRIVNIQAAGTYTFQYAPHGLEVWSGGNRIGYPTFLGDILLRVSILQ